MELRSDPGHRLGSTALSVIVAFTCGVVIAAILVPSDGDGSSAAQPVAPSGVSAGAAAVAESPMSTVPGTVAPMTSPSMQASAGGSAASSPAPSPAAAASTPSSAASSGSNGGATFRGVTATKVKLGFANLDSGPMAPVCPRCGNGAGADGAAANALVEAWRRDKVLPIYGRDFEIVNRKYNILSAEDARNACVQLAQQDKPFAVGGVSMRTFAPCLAREFKLMTIDGQQAGYESDLRSMAPRLYQIQPTADRVWRNFPVWADKQNLLKGQVLGMYSPSDSAQGAAGIQEALSGSFRAMLTKLGYKLAVDMQYETVNSDPVAVQRFRAAGVTVAFVFGLLTEPNGFQSAAEKIGYRPKYPIAEVQNETTDAVADVTYNPDAQDGNLAMKTQFFDFAARRPAKPLNNAKAEYCLRAYEAYTHRTIDAYDNDAEIHYMLEICSVLDVMREAMVKAGPNLTEQSFLQGLYQVRGMQTAYELSVTYGPSKFGGGDLFATARFNKGRVQPSNDYFGNVTGWGPYFVP
jgi:hypothetical protein